jgi:DNA-binding NarL/FixJ family response regulator
MKKKKIHFEVFEMVPPEWTHGMFIERSSDGKVVDFGKYDSQFSLRDTIKEIVDRKIIKLSQKQKRCLLLFCDGYSERDIEKKLGISDSTVHRYLKLAGKLIKEKWRATNEKD